jgi:hypothetical protein
VQITINRDGQQMGPYTVEQINEYLAQGSLLPTDHAWHEGMPDWVPVTQISGVGPAAAPPPFNPAQAPAVAPEGNAKKKKLLLIGGIAGGVALIAVLALVLLKGPSNEYIGIWWSVDRNDAYFHVMEDGTAFLKRGKKSPEYGTWKVENGELYIMGIDGNEAFVFKIGDKREKMNLVAFDRDGDRSDNSGKERFNWLLVNEEDPRIINIGK